MSSVKKGWLSKREEVSGSLTTWRKRWFVLNEEELSWYKSDRVRELSNIYVMLDVEKGKGC